MIIDAHVHLADELTGFWQPLRHGRVVDHGQVIQAMPPSFDPPASPAARYVAHMEEAGVDMAFLVQHHLYGDQNQTVLKAISRWPGRFAGFAYLGKMDQVDDADRLQSLIELGMSGLKVELATTRRLRPGFRYDGAIETTLWQRLVELDAPLILDVNGCSDDDLAALHNMFEKYRTLRVIVCHLGGAPQAGWRERALLADHPNVWLDIASIAYGFGPEHEYPYPKAQGLIQWAVGRYGAEKVVWGTDYPGQLKHSTYRQWIDLVRRHCTFMSLDEKEWVLGGSALRFLRASV